MTDKFQCPEPSWEATGKARIPIQAEVNAHWPLDRKPWYIYDANIEAGLRAAYAVDVPQIVRAEVERAVKALLTSYDHETFNAEIAKYCDQRFGEGEPKEVVVCSVPGCNCRSAPTERRERTFIPSIGGGQFVSEFTQADRDRLARLERFVTALAKREAERGADGWVVATVQQGVADAAREFLRP